MLHHYQIHHVAIVVSDLDAAVKKHMRAYSYRELPREKVEEFGAEVAFLYPEKSDDSVTALEIIAPLSEEGGLAKFLQTRGEGLHHICYEVEDIAAEQEQLETLGYRFIDKSPRKGAHNSLVSFIHPKSCNGVLTELRQSL